MRRCPGTPLQKILGNCTENLYQFQQELSELVRFFDVLYNFVDTTYRTQGEDFPRSAGNLKTMLDHVPAEERAAFKQARMDDMMVASLKLRGYYAVMREMSGTCVEVSRKFIMPGVNQVDQLSLTDSSSVSQSQISNFAGTAQAKINELANKRKKGLQDQLMKKRAKRRRLDMMEQASAAVSGEGSAESAWAL